MNETKKQTDVMHPERFPGVPTAFNEQAFLREWAKRKRYSGRNRRKMSDSDIRNAWRV